MALKTLGTKTTSNMSAFVMNTDLTAADAATLRSYIWNDGLSSTAPASALVVPGAFEFRGGQGLLYVPRRGVLQVLPGDYIGIDETNGWPILLSAGAISGWVGTTLWDHS